MFYIKHFEFLIGPLENEQNNIKFQISGGCFIGARAWPASRITAAAWYSFLQAAWWRAESWRGL